MRRTALLALISLLLTGSAAAISIPFLDSGGSSFEPVEEGQLNINVEVSGENDIQIVDSGGYAVYITDTSMETDDRCLIDVNRIQGGAATIAVDPGGKLDSETDFPESSSYEVVSDGAGQVYENLGGDSQVTVEGSVEADFPIKCLTDNDEARWSSVDTGAGGLPCDEYPEAAGCGGGGGYTDAQEGDYSDEQGSGDVDCSEVENPNLYPDCTSGGSDDSGNSNEDGIECTEVENPNLYAECSGGGYTRGPTDGGGNGYTPSYIEKEFTRAEWAAVAGVDPDFITEDNASNLNERSMGYEQAVLAARRAADANGWYDESGRRFDILTEMMTEDNAEVTGAGQGFQAAGGNYIVTDGTASPYQSDGCYSDHDYRPPEYGELSDMSPGMIQGGNWNPDDYNCPSWMQGGEVFYEADMLEVDWSKIEEMDTSASGAVDDGDSGSSDDSDSGSDSDDSDSSGGLQVSAEAATGDGFSWKNYCSDNADDIGINAEDGISSSEAATCVEPCWGASASDATPQNENAQCGEMVKDFCNPFFDYDSDTNTCEVG